MDCDDDVLSGRPALLFVNTSERGSFQRDLSERRHSLVEVSIGELQTGEESSRCIIIGRAVEFFTSLRPESEKGHNFVIERR